MDEIHKQAIVLEAQVANAQPTLDVLDSPDQKKANMRSFGSAR